MEKVALVTGSSRGIGRADAIKLAKDGYKICINYIERDDKAKEVVDLIKSSGGEAISYKADVSDSNAVISMVKYIEKNFGYVSLLVNNAGIAHQYQIQDMTDEFLERIFKVNVGGAFNTIRAVLPRMLHEHEGCIINTASIWGLNGASCESAYSATKHAIVGLTKSLANELALSNIRVNCVAPGVIDTDMVKILGEDTLNMLSEDTPLRRLGKPEDIAEMVSFLASNKASFITGQIITIDGGFKN